jgi:hypothetical protein
MPPRRNKQIIDKNGRTPFAAMSFAIRTIHFEKNQGKA